MMGIKYVKDINMFCNLSHGYSVVSIQAAWTEKFSNVSALVSVFSAGMTHQTPSSTQVTTGEQSHVLCKCVCVYINHYS